MTRCSGWKFLCRLRRIDCDVARRVQKTKETSLYGAACVWSWSRHPILRIQHTVTHRIRLRAMRFRHH